MSEQRKAFWTHDDEAVETVGHLYYFAPVNRMPSPYLRQIHVEAIVDVAADGTLAGVELIDGRMPPPPSGPFPADEPDALDAQSKLLAETVEVLTITRTFVDSMRRNGVSNTLVLAEPIERLLTKLTGASK